MTTDAYYIVDGRIVVEDGNKATEEYAPTRKVRVELGFSTPDDTDDEKNAHIVRNVAKIASAQVDDLLGRTSKPSATSTAGSTAEDDKPKRTRRTKEQIAADEAAAAKADAALKAADPGSIDEFEDETPTAVDGFDAAGNPVDDAGAVDEFEDDFSAVEPEVETVSDEDLNAAVQKRNGELKPTLKDQAAVKIRGLISSYNPDPTAVFQLRQIPAAKRAEFLTKLKAIA